MQMCIRDSTQRRGLPPKKQRIGTVTDPAQAHDRSALRGNDFTFLISESLLDRAGGEQAGAGYNESLHIGMFCFRQKYENIFTVRRHAPSD